MHSWSTESSKSCPGTPICTFDSSKPQNTRRDGIRWTWSRVVPVRVLELFEVKLFICYVSVQLLEL